jgi:hypothetical protein
MTALSTKFHMHNVGGSLVMGVIRTGNDVSDEIITYWDVMPSMYSGRRLPMLLRKIMTVTIESILVIMYI